MRVAYMAGVDKIDVLLYRGRGKAEAVKAASAANTQSCRNA